MGGDREGSRRSQTTRRQMTHRPKHRKKGRPDTIQTQADKRTHGGSNRAADTSREGERGRQGGQAQTSSEQGSAESRAALLTQGGRAERGAERVNRVKPTIRGRHAACALQHTLCGEAYHTRTACSARTPAHAVCQPSVVSSARTGDTISHHTKPHTKLTYTKRQPCGRSKGTRRDEHRDCTWAGACRETVPMAEGGIQPPPDRGIVSMCRPKPTCAML